MSRPLKHAYTPEIDAEILAIPLGSRLDAYQPLSDKYNIPSRTLRGRRSTLRQRERDHLRYHERVRDLPPAPRIRNRVATFARPAWFEENLQAMTKGGLGAGS